MKLKAISSLFAALCAVLVITPAAVGDDFKIPGMKKAPAAAAEALTKYAAAAGMKIEKVAVEKHGKVTVYEAELKAEGKADREVAVTADGKLKGEEETVPLDKVPEAARKAIEANAKGANHVQKRCPNFVAETPSRMIGPPSVKPLVSSLKAGAAK